MAGRSLTPTPQGIQQALAARTGKGWSVEDLAEKVVIQGKKPTTGIGVATVKKFFAGKSVDRKYFVGICNALEVEWEAIAGLPQPQLTPQPQNSPTPQLEIGTLVQIIRQKVYADIHHRCGIMRVLDMEQPIDVGDIYTSVNILEKLSGRRRLGIDDLCGEQEPVPGLRAVERYDKLMIFGKPGSGKTTFMKRMATLCSQGVFLTDFVPVFVMLKEFAEAQSKPSVQEYVAQQWQQNCDVDDASSITKILKAGKAIILLDGLDEVLEKEQNWVLQAIKEATYQFRKCQFVITCRIAAQECAFEHFSEVEMADFDKKQIAEFVRKWFTAKGNPQKSKIFMSQLETQQAIQSLANSPLLLSLLCLVFEEKSEFPKKRSDLYKESIHWLLKKWDETSKVERNQVYEEFSLKHKEDFLSQLAFKTFEQGKIFFSREIVQEHIIDYIQSSCATQCNDVYQLNIEDILKSIEAQHGLLVKRSQEFYSFSYLTFQEYFTAKYLTSTTDENPENWKGLVSKITQKRYREIFFISISMLAKSDDLLLLMKQEIDKLVQNESILQSLLFWNYQKSNLVSSPYKTSAIRAIYLAFILPLEYSSELELLCFHNENPFNHILNVKFEFALNYFISLSCSLDLNFDNNLNSQDQNSGIFGKAFDRSFSSDIDLDRLLLNILDQSVSTSQKPFLGNLYPGVLLYSLGQVLSKPASDDLQFQVQMMALSRELGDYETFEQDQQWWNTTGMKWIARLRTVMIEHRNIGHDWQLPKAQRDKLHKYYQANLLLVQCLNSGCSVTNETRQEIEDTLLLPVSEIEKRNNKF